MIKFGKTPARLDAVKLKFSTVFNEAVLPTPPATFGHEGTIPGGAWSMLANDRWGDCLVEGTIASGFDIKGAYKAPYNGTIVTISALSGKKLSVTPNHAILTTRGFVRAKDLQKGDNLVSTSGTQVLPSSSLIFSKEDLNHSPAPIEKIFSSSRFSIGSTLEIVPRPIDFHGDGKFFNGNIKIVRADSLLRYKINPSLCEPNTKNEIRSTSQLQAILIRAGTFGLANLRSLFSSFSNVGVGSYGTSLSYSHVGVTKTQALCLGTKYISRCNDFFFKMSSRDTKFFTGVLDGSPSNIPSDSSTDITIPFSTGNDPDRSIRSDLIANSRHPSSNGRPTDPHLFSYLNKAFPGLIESDCVTEIDVQRNCRTHVYDLSTGPRWYTANGIIVHNCVWAGAAHEHMLWTTEGGLPPAKFTSAGVLSDYSVVTGFNPLNPNTDQGTDIQAAAAYRQKTGVVDANGYRHKIDAYAALKVGDLNQLALATWLFGAVGVGVVCPFSMQDQFNSNQPWSVVEGDSTEGGHYIPCVGKNSAGNFIFITWGRIQAATPDWVAKYMDEGVAYLSLEIINSSTKVTPESFNLDALTQYLKEV